jgi:uncharacterized protein
MAGATAPVTVHVLDLLHAPGARRDLVDVAVLGPLAVTASRVPDGAEVTYALVVEAQSAQVIVTGAVHAPWAGECRRCLGPTGGEVHASVREVFERNPVEGETWPLAGDHIDLAPVLAQAVVLELPLAPLCRPDCPGPDPARFEVTTEQDAPPPARDPRWAALDALHFDDDDDAAGGGRAEGDDPDGPEGDR